MIGPAQRQLTTTAVRGCRPATWLSRSDDSQQERGEPARPCPSRPCRVFTGKGQGDGQRDTPASARTHQSARLAPCYLLNMQVAAVAACTITNVTVAKYRLCRTCTSMARPADKDVPVLARVVVRAGLPGQLEMRVDDIGHLTQERCCPLLPVVPVVDTVPGNGLRAAHRGLHLRIEDLVLDRVAPEGLKPDGVEHGDPVDMPADRRYPVNGLQNPPGSGWRDDIVADALHIHLRAGETGPLPQIFSCSS